MDHSDVIDFSKNDYWDKEGFLEDIERIRKLVVELLANVSDDYEAHPREIGYCLGVFEILKRMEIVDGRQKQEP